MSNTDYNSQSSCGDDQSYSVNDFLVKAAHALSGGSTELALHLYLAAFERSKHAPDNCINEAAVEGLKKAWSLACSLKERALAEYVFEQLEPFLSNEEMMACTAQLQDLALDKLEEYGLSREELEDMTEMISQDFGGLGIPTMLQIDGKFLGLHPDARDEGVLDAGEAQGPTSASDAAPCAEEPNAASVNDGDAKQQGSAKASAGSSKENLASHSKNALKKAIEDSLSEGSAHIETIERIDFSNLVGYDRAIAALNNFGIGMAHDAAFQELVKTLNARHGLSAMPACDTLFLRSPAREDANRLASAVIGELGLPAMRMHMEENLQGVPVLCVMAQADNQPKLNVSRNEFRGPGILVLEDLDSWMAPEAASCPEDFSGFLMASLSRGAREAINLIRSAVESPDVYVVATMANNRDIDGFFFDLLDPVSIVDIDYPNAAERGDIWLEIAREHPSVRGINREQLIRLSANMPRFDIYMAAREALEEAYKESLASRKYVPVTADNVFDKLAAYQPLDSAEYQALEEAVVSSFKQDLDHLEDLLDTGNRE